MLHEDVEQQPVRRLKAGADPADEPEQSQLRRHQKRGRADTAQADEPRGQASAAIRCLQEHPLCR